MRTLGFKSRAYGDICQQMLGASIEPGEERGSAGLAEQLRRHELFAECTDAQLDKVCASAIVRSGRRRDIIVHQDEPFPYVGYVLSGVIAITRLAAPCRGDGDVRTLRLYEAFDGATFIEATPFEDSSTTLGQVSVISKHARYALMSNDVFFQISQEDPAFLRRLGQCVNKRTRELTRRLAAQAVDPIPCRVASVLLPFASNEPGMQAANPYLTELTQLDLAASAGTVKEVVARTIAELEDAGALRRQGGHIRYLNRDALLRYTKI
jgi:CRP/FNR family transcriptional regulator